MKRKLFVAVGGMMLATFAVAPLAVFAEDGEPIVDEDTPSLVQFVWADDLSNGPLFDLDQFTVKLENTADEKVTAIASVVLFGTSDPVELSIGDATLEPGETTEIQIPVDSLPVKSSDYSIQIVGRAVAEISTGQKFGHHTESLYFHIDSESKFAVLYNELQLIKEFNGGLLNGADSVKEPGVTVLSIASEKELEEAEWAASEIGSSETESFGSDPMPLTNYSVNVCGKWRTWFEDVDLGEDIWTSTGYYYRAARHAYAKIMQGSTEKWKGYLSESGCKSITLSGGTYTLKQWPVINDSGGSYDVYKCLWDYGLGDWVCNVNAIEKEFTVSASGTIDVNYPNTGAWVNVSALVGWLMESPDNGMPTGVLNTDVHVGEPCPGVDDPASCFDRDHTIYIYGDTGLRKFPIAHEVGHQSQWNTTGYLGIHDYYDDPEQWQCRCDHVVSGSDLHCLQSREYIDVAMSEGFAYFFASKLFNEEDESDCYMGYGKEVLMPDYLYWDDGWYATLEYPPVTTNCRYEPQIFRTWDTFYCPAAGTGVEWDWMLFFWNWHSDGISDHHVTMSQLYPIIDMYQTYDWEELNNRAFSYFGSDPGNDYYEYFYQTADDYGVIH